MHLPILHISSRDIVLPHDEDPLHLGTIEGRDIIPWLADPVRAIKRVQNWTPSLDAASLAMAAIGSEITYFATLAGLFSAYDRKTALALAGVVIPSVTVNQIVKVRFKFPRPPKEARHPLAYIAPGDFTFPSGHAQNAVVLGIFLALRARHRWVRVLGLALGSTIPLSRIYLGVHYPRDVLAGTLLGIGTYAAVTKLEPSFRDWWVRMPRGSRGFAFSIGSSMASLLTGNPLAAFPLSVGGGLALGQDLSGQARFMLDRPEGRKQRIAQGAIGVGLFLAVGFAVRPLVKRESTSAATLAGQLTGLALTFGVPMANDLAQRYRLWRRRRHKQYQRTMQRARQAQSQRQPQKRKR